MLGRAAWPEGLRPGAVSHLSAQLPDEEPCEAEHARPPERAVSPRASSAGRAGELAADRPRAEAARYSPEPVNQSLERVYGVGYRLFRRQGGRSAQGLGRSLQGMPWPISAQGGKAPGCKLGCGAPAQILIGAVADEEFSRAVIRDVAL